MRENAAAEEDRVCPGERILSDVDRLGGLPVGGEIDAVGEQLGTKPANGSEGAYAHPRRAIDEVAAADSGMAFHDQLGLPVGLMREMATGAAWKTGNPVKLSDNGVGAEVEQVDVLADSQMANA